MRSLKRLGLSLLVLLAIAAVLPYLIPMPARDLVPKKSPFVNGRFSDACGLRWHVQRWAAETPASEAARGRIVLLHGFAGSTFSWRLTGPALAAAGYEAMAIDMPPYGYTDRGTPDRPIADCIVEIVRGEAGELPLTVIGHSMGASVAARVSQQLGERAEALVLVDGGLGGRSRPSGVRAWMLQLPPVGRWAEVFAHHRMLQPERFAQTLASAYGREPSEAEIDGYRTPLLLAGTAPRVLGRAPSPGPLDLAALPRRQLILWGREDAWVPPAWAERTAAELPTAQLEWIEAAGHNPMETHPDIFMDRLLAFLQKPAAADSPPPATD